MSNDKDAPARRDKTARSIDPITGKRLQPLGRAAEGGMFVRRRRPVGIVDIGSNSVRLVVYDGLTRTPVPLFNEKAVCALGSGLERSGRLNPEGVTMALAAVERFVHLARAMDVDTLDVLATAAARDAADGPEFIARLEERCGVKVRLLSGEEEARNAALGVLCSIPDADGMVADLGGGSLELVMVENHRFGDFTSMPLGVLRLQDHSGGDRDKAVGIIDGHLAALGWLGQGRGRSLYAVGGAWRTIARICIEQMDYPLHVLDNFTLPAGDATGLLDLIARQSRKSLEKIPGVSKRRLPTLPMAAVALQRLIEVVEPSELVFSVYGMREGQFFQNLPPAVRDEDPLISACADLALAAGRFTQHARELMDWMSPLFPEESAQLQRLRLAACLLGDIFWSEHPDYRAEQGLLKVLRLPFMGLSHTDRAALALAVYFRYASSSDQPYARQAAAMLDEERVKRVRIIGNALRLGHTISGGAPGLLERTRLRWTPGRLTLDVPAGDPLFSGDASVRRFEKLAAMLGVPDYAVVPV
ncbi:Ppx/GppA family phosphatase [Caenispirillum salinarum]|uniref:Ppx/GppA family phosphatase n=1 Tax=Caenispirillum salinarum TaxID=859058 RepID=UPI0038511059